MSTRICHRDNWRTVSHESLLLLSHPFDMVIGTWIVDQEG